MTSQERHEARYQRRKAARQARRDARCAALGSIGEVFSYHTMYMYGKKCCNNVRWKQSVQNFERHLFSGTARRRREVMQKRWKPKPYVHFTLCERGKVRPIDAPHITDRQIHKVLSKEVLVPLYSPSLIYDNGASREGKGLHWQYKRIKQQLARHYRKYGRAGGVLLLDLKKFFPYAPQSIIYQRHQQLILNDDLRCLADSIVKSAPSSIPGRGMPLGVELSQQEMVALPSAVDNWMKCQLGLKAVCHYMDDYLIIFPDLEELKKLGHEIVRRFESFGIPVNRKKCKIIPLTKPFRWCKARFTLTETGKIKVNGSRDGVKRARRKLKLFHREWLAGKRTLQEVAQYMCCQEAYYKNFDDHGRLLRLRRLCYAIFGGKVPCSKKIVKANDGTILALTEDVTYIKRAENGCYILCPEPDASGISYAGTPYHLFGRKPLDDAESVILEPTDIGGWIMEAKAAIDDADEMNVDQAYRLTLLELNVSDTDDTENT